MESPASDTNERPGDRNPPRKRKTKKRSMLGRQSSSSMQNAAQIEDDTTTEDTLDDLLHECYQLTTKLTAFNTTNLASPPTTSPIENNEEKKMFSDEEMKGFRSNFADCINSLSHRSTAVAIQFDGLKQNEVNSENNTQLIKTLHNIFKVFGTLCEAMGPHAGCGVGRLWTSIWLTACLDIAKCMSTLVVSLKSANSRSNLRNTATLWEACDRALALPADNAQVYLHNITQSERLVDDAIRELQGSGELIDERISPVLQYVIGLSKCAKSTLRLLATCHCAPDDVPITVVCAQQDAINQQVELVSPAIDDLATAYYEVEEDLQSADAIGELTSTITNLTGVLRRITELFESSAYYKSDQHSSKLELLRRAYDHNSGKLSSSVQGIRPFMDINDDME